MASNSAQITLDRHGVYTAARTAQVQQERKREAELESQCREYQGRREREGQEVKREQQKLCK